MKSIPDLINQLQTQWGEPRFASHQGDAVPFQLVCEFAPPHEKNPHDFDKEFPPELAEFWRNVSSASLFKDARYGQWGLEIFDLPNAKAESKKQCLARPRDFTESDIIVGRFLGDSDLLVVRNDSSAEDFGAILVALPLDRREDWDFAAPSFSVFLERLTRSEGEKFWEVK